MERITRDPAVLDGQPTVRGMRISVATVLNHLATGASVEDVLADFPYLEREDIYATLAYASVVLGGVDPSSSPTNPGT